MEQDRQATSRQGGRRLKSLVTGITLLLIGIELVLLGGYAYRGIFSRYLQDDYCYSAEVVALGFFPAQIHSYFHPMPYNSDRFSLTLFSGIAELAGGPRFVPYLSGLSILFWVAGLFFALYQWSRYFQLPVRKLVIFAVSCTIILLFFYISPNLYQILYWRSAMFPYLTPLIFNTWLLGFFFYLIRMQKMPFLSGVSFGLLCVIAGGFSETAGLWQLSVWGLIFLLFLLQNPRDKFVMKTLAIPVASSGLALLLMALGPGNSAQLQPFVRPNFTQLIGLSLKFTQDFISVSLRSLILPFCIIGCLGLFFGLQTLSTRINSFRVLISSILLATIFCYVTVFSDMVPTVLAMSSYPGDRALSPAFLTLILYVFFLGWSGAQFLQSQATWSRHLQLSTSASLVLVITFLFYAFWISHRILIPLSPIQHRAEAWDMRQNMILDAKARGETNVVVPAFDSIAQIFELYPKENFWVNSCAAKYYGIKGLAAIEGYNGIKPIFH